ncbi:MAG: amino acid/amide transporter rane protein 1, family [Actinomycetia bacterium]|nr:amino acid/amide transporter rane protein 1, family [Actinomycetes bacterium]
MARFVALLASGIAFGAVMALVAAGFLVLYKATSVVNFAHGSLVTLGAYLAVWSIADLGMPTLLGYAVALVLMVGVGVCLELIAHAPLRGRSHLVVVIATLAASVVIEALISLWQGSTPRVLATPVGSRTLKVFGANIAAQRILIVVVAAVAIAILMLVFQRTSFGRQVRALAADPEAAQLQGVRVRRVSIAAFAISSFLAGLAGILIAPLTAVDLTFGFTLMLTAFAAATLGGFGNLPGVIVGGLVIGLVQQVAGGYVFRQYADTLPFVVMFVIIAVRPQGLFSGVGGTRL